MHQENRHEIGGVEGGSRRPRHDCLSSWSALVEAARQALLAALLIDKGGLPALLAEIADPLPCAHVSRRRIPRWLDLADVLGQGPGQRIGQGQDFSRAKTSRLTTADPGKLADDFLESPLSRAR